MLVLLLLALSVVARRHTVSPTASDGPPCYVRAIPQCTGTCRETWGAHIFYGCQAIDFCDFIGTTKVQKLQCGLKPKYCSWVKGRCTNGKPTMSPVAPVAPYICNDGCFTPANGVCNDGGPGSVNHLCPYGSDCTDCGHRG